MPSLSPWVLMSGSTSTACPLPPNSYPPRLPSPPLLLAQFVLKAGADLMSSELEGVDKACSRDGVRNERVSGGLENLVKAKAFVYFLQTGVMAFSFVFFVVLFLRA